MSYTDSNTFCSNTSCHTGITVPGSNLVVSHTNELMTLDKRTWPSWDPKCVDCHDPHGDATNLKMVATDIFDRGSNAHGVPTESLNSISRTLDVVDFTVQDWISAGSYADSASGADGVCQECHLATDGSATGLLSFQDDNPVPLSPAGNHPPSGTSCRLCHKHNTAFEPSAATAVTVSQTASSGRTAPTDRRPTPTTRLGRTSFMSSRSASRSTG